MSVVLLVLLPMITSRWSLFFSELSQASYQKIIECNGCRTSDSEYVKLLSLVKGGNELAISLAFGQISSRDGGELGDLYRALGLSLEARPSLFIESVQKLNLEGKSLEPLLTMLPLETVDNLKLKYEMLENRLRIVDQKIVFCDYQEAFRKILKAEIAKVKGLIDLGD